MVQNKTAKKFTTDRVSARSEEKFGTKMKKTGEAREPPEYESPEDPQMTLVKSPEEDPPRSLPRSPKEDSPNTRTPKNSSTAPLSASSCGSSSKSPLLAPPSSGTSQNAPSIEVLEAEEDPHEELKLSRSVESSGLLQKRRQAKRRGVRLNSEPQQMEEFLLLPQQRQQNDAGGDPEGGSGQGGGGGGAGGTPVSPRTIAVGVASAFSLVRKVSQRVSNKKPGKVTYLCGCFVLSLASSRDKKNPLDRSCIATVDLACNFLH